MLVNYLVAAVSVAASAGSVEGPPLLRPDMDMRFSAFFTMVFIRVNILLPTLFSLGTDGPPCAGELMVLVLAWSVVLRLGQALSPAASTVRYAVDGKWHYVG